MPTDTERREVARRLRGPFDVIGQGRYVSLNGTVFGMQLLANSENELRAGVRRLADLIDPGEPEGVCGECSHFNASERFLPCDAFHGLTIADVSACEDFEPRKFDRAALLVLADELDKDADNIISAARDARFTGGRPRMGEAEHDAYEWRCIARRIREALGADDGR